MESNFSLLYQSRCDTKSWAVYQEIGIKLSTLHFVDNLIYHLSHNQPPLFIYFLSNWKIMCLIHTPNKVQKDLDVITPLNMLFKSMAVFSVSCPAFLYSLHVLFPSPLVPLSCSRGSPSHGGILAPTLLLCAACSPNAAWSPSPARLRSCTWSSRTVRWESRTWPSPGGCAASVWGCSTALRERKRDYRDEMDGC